jgi:hypothetical protein
VKAALQAALLTRTTPLTPTVQLAIPAVTSGQIKTPANGCSLSVDQVTLTVTYTTTSTPPPPPPVTTTVLLTPWSSTENFIDSAGGNPGHPARFVVQGATYAPNGVVHIEDGQEDIIAFRWGLVAWGVNFKTYPQILFGMPLVSIPAPGPGLGSNVTAVDLTVFVCVDGCPSGETKALQVRVLITDPPYPPTGHPTVGNRRIQVLSWARQR